jgi:hypothetical protein
MMIVLDDGVYIEDGYSITTLDEYVRFHDESGTPISINAKLVMKLYPTAKRIIYEDDDGRC